MDQGVAVHSGNIGFHVLLNIHSFSSFQDLLRKIVASSEQAP